MRHELFSGLPAIGNEIKILGWRRAWWSPERKQISNYPAPDDRRISAGHRYCPVVLLIRAT
jgi:hypothetical protein